MITAQKNQQRDQQQHHRRRQRPTRPRVVLPFCLTTMMTLSTLLLVQMFQQPCEAFVPTTITTTTTTTTNINNHHRHHLPPVTSSKTRTTTRLTNFDIFTPSSSPSSSSSSSSSIRRRNKKSSVQAVTAAAASTTSTTSTKTIFEVSEGLRVISPTKLLQAIQLMALHMLKEGRWADLTLIFLLIRGPLPLARRIYQFPSRLFSPVRDDDHHENHYNNKTIGGHDSNSSNLYKEFQQSKVRKIAQSITFVGELLGLLYGIEAVILFMKEMGVELVQQYPVYKWASSTIGALWGARRLSGFKYDMLTRRNPANIATEEGTSTTNDILNDINTVNGSVSASTPAVAAGDRSNTSRSLHRVNRFRARWTNRGFDILIYACAGLAVMDFLSVRTGFTLGSLFGISGIGTLVVSLASRELIREFLASLAIQSTNMYSEGDMISLDDGTTGIVQKLGWLNTHIRRRDEYIVRIPNTQLSSNRLANVSRSQHSTVIQTLMISYDDMDKLPEFIKDAKKEIRDSCPSLIDDGSRPFRVFWNDFKEFSLDVLVEAHLRIKPMTDDYASGRESILMAIARAAKKNKITFSYSNFARARDGTGNNLLMTVPTR